MKIASTLFLFFSFFLCGFSFAQQVTFEKTFNYGGAEEGRCVQQTRDGGYIIAGRQGVGIGISRNMLIKTDSLGNEQWHKLFGTGNNELNSIKQTYDGGYVITGQSTGAQAFMYDIFWAKTDANGDTVWAKRFLAPPPDYIGEGADIIQTPDSGYVILADMLDTNYSSVCVLIKANANGDTLWTKKFTSPFPGIVGYQCKLTSDSGYIIAGSIGYRDSITGAISSDVYLIKVSCNGDSIFLKTIPEPNFERGLNVVITSDTNYFIRGSIAYLSNSILDIHVLKLSNDFDTLWTKNIGGIEDKTGSGADINGNNGIFISGSIDNVSTNSVYLFLASLDGYGDTLWTKIFGDGNGAGDVGQFIQRSSDGGAIITGYHSFDAYLIKVDSLGNVVIDVKEIFKENIEMTVFPSPFITEAFVVIPSELKNASEIELVLSDMLGKEIERIKVYDKQVILYRSGLKTGMYVLQLYSAKELISVKKIIIQ